MKKIIILLMLVVFFTGCSANVDIHITSSTIKEEVKITSYSNSQTTKEQIFNQFREYMPVFDSTPLSDTEPDINKKGIEYYTRKYKDLGSGYEFTYNYNYKFEDYKKSKSIHGFNSYTIQRNSVDKNIMISTDKGGLKYFEQYPDLEHVTINIRTPYKVLENNADYTNGNMYTWVLRKNSNKGIYMLISDPNADIPNEKKEEPKEEPNEDKKTEHVVVENKEESEIIKFVNEYPILVGIASILGFFVLIIIFSKIFKVK